MIETFGLSMAFGEIVALDSLSMQVERGDVFGLIGPNGAGKTTTMKILTTLLAPSGGDAEVNGVRLSENPAAIRRVIGFMPDFIGLYDDMTVLEYLRFFAAARRIPRQKSEGIIDDVLTLTELKSKNDSLVSALSRGMQQRLGIAQILLHDPEVLLLDEPASGLDPRGRVEMRGLLQELSRMGKTIVISSHILLELGSLCNRIGIIDRGRLVFSGSMEQARASALGGKVLVVEVRDNPRAAQALLAGCKGVSSTERDGNMVTVFYETGAGDGQEAARALVEAGFSVTRFTDDDSDLEMVFRQIVSKARGGERDTGSMLATDIYEQCEAADEGDEGEA